MTPILSNILPLVAAHARSQARSFLEGQPSIGGTVDQEIWEFLARHDVLWDSLTVADQDRIRDGYLESFKQTCVQRIAPSDPDEWTSTHGATVLFVKETSAAASLGESGTLFQLKLHNALNVLSEAYEHVSLRFKGNLTNNGNMVTALRKLGEGIDILNELASEAPNVSSVVLSPSVPEVVKDAQKALTASKRQLASLGAHYTPSQVGHIETEAVISQVESALSALRLLTSKESPEGVRPPQGCAPSYVTDV